MCVCCSTPTWPLMLCCSSRKRRIILFLRSKIIGFFVAVETCALASLLFDRRIPSLSIEGLGLNWINLLLFWIGLCVSWFTSSSKDCCWDRRKRNFSASKICGSHVRFVLEVFHFDDYGSDFNLWLNLLASMRFWSIGCRRVPWSFFSALFKKTFSCWCSSVVQLSLEARRNCGPCNQGHFSVISVAVSPLVPWSAWLSLVLT